MTNNTFPVSYKDPVYAAADQSASEAAGIPPGLLTSIRVAGEKSNANQTSSSGATTPYQFTPSTRDLIIKKYKIDPLSSPQAAALGAAYLLKEGIQRTGSAAGAVTQYIGGTDPKNWGGQTRAYTNRVMAHFTGNGGQDTPQPEPIPNAPLPSAASYGLDPSVVGTDSAPQQQPTAAVQAPQPIAPAAGVNNQIVADYNAGRLSPEDMAAVEQRASKIGIDPSQLQRPQTVPGTGQPGPGTAAPPGSTAPAQSSKPIGPQTLAAMQAGKLTPDQLATIKAGLDNGTLTMPQSAPAPAAPAQDPTGPQNDGYFAAGLPASAAPTAPFTPTTAAKNGSTWSDVAEKAVGGVAGSLLDIASAGGRLVGANDFADQANAAHKQIDDRMAQDTNNSTAGKVAGFVGSAAPYAAMGGASLPGAVAGGAVAGAAPSIAQNKSGAEVARDAAVGGAAGAAGMGLGKVAGKAVSAIAENPTVAKGIARLQQMFGGTPSEATKVAASGGAADAQVAADIASATGHKPADLASKIESAPAPHTPGYTPTAAEMANDANVTTLQKAATNANPSTFANASANNDEAIAKSLAKPATGEVSGTGAYSDGGKWDAHYTTQKNTDGSVSLIRDIGNGPEHLNVDGLWSKGLPARTRVPGAQQIAGPEAFTSVEHAIAAARDDIEGMGGKALDSGATPGAPAAPQAAEQAGEAAAQKSDALAAQGQSEVNPLEKHVTDRLQTPQFEAPVKLAQKMAKDQGSTVFDDLQAAKHAEAAKALDQITGTPEELAAAKASRSADAADNFLPMNKSTTLDSDAWKGLANRPTFREAIGEAQGIAADRGEQAAIKVNEDGSVTATGRGLLDAKQAIDGLISKASMAGDASKVMRYKAVKDALLSEMDNAYPEYGAARAKYAEASGPIDAMQALQARVNGAVDPATGQVNPAKLVNTINSIKAEQMKPGIRPADKVPDETLNALAALAQHLQNKNDLTGLPAEGQEYIRRALASSDKHAAAHEEFKSILDAQSPSYKELHGAHAQNVAAIESQKTSQTALAQAEEAIKNADSPGSLKALDKLLPNMEAADRAKAIALRQQKARELAMDEVQSRNLNSRGSTEFNRSTFNSASEKYSPFMAKEDAAKFGSVAQDLHNQTTTYAKTGKIGGSDTMQNQSAAKRFGRNLGDAFKDAAVQSLIAGGIGSAFGPAGTVGGMAAGAITGALSRTITQKVSSITTENAAKLLSNGKLLAAALRNYDSIAARRLFIDKLSQRAGYVAGATAANKFNGSR
jgi:hypothetical protein